MSVPIIETRCLSKVFGSLKACDKINLKIEAGTIHSVAGENGAGKSTLMKMLYGVYPASSGEILIDGQPIKQWSASIAREKGIGMVFQDFRLIPAFSVIDNVFLSNPSFGNRIDRTLLYNRILDLSHKYNLDVDPNADVWKLDLGQRQHVEILKVLMSENTRVLIFDEPTSVLAPHEIRAFLDMLLQLKKDNYAIILITHKIKEIMDVADVITVLRQGRLVDTFYRQDTFSEEKIVASMLNTDSADLNLEYKRYDEMAVKPTTHSNAPLLSLRDASIRDNHNQDIIYKSSLCMNEGEILGVAGISGNGQRELVEALFGMRKIHSGQLTISGIDHSNSNTISRIQAGMRIVTEDPIKDHVIKSFSILQHMALVGIPVERKGLNIDWAAMRDKFYQYDVIKNMKVPSPDRYAIQLSGGNLQRMIFARAAISNPKILLVSYPSRGLDVGSVKAVHNTLLDLRRKGTAILFISEDVSELFSICDRIIVLANHKIYGSYLPEKITQEQIGRIMLKGDDT